MEDELQIRQIIDESDAIIACAHQLFEDMGRDDSGLPKGAAMDEPFRIVFAGQYSAGKSSLVKALTGNSEIEIGQGVTTQTATSYPWHGMLIIDTPGIGTGISCYAEHDATSREAIFRADALVYVVTSEGFDNLIAEEFRNLIIDQDKAAETILVVNKMMDCADGNSVEQRAIIAGDLAEISYPYTPEDLHVVFVDAESYLESVETEAVDPHLSAILREDSNLDDLVAALDDVSRSSEVGARLTTPLYQTMGEIDKAIEDLDDVDSEQLLVFRRKLREERRAIGNIRTSILSRAQGEYTVAASEIREEGRKLADAINACESESDSEGLISEATQRVFVIESECMAKIDGMLQEGADELDLSFENLCGSLSRDFEVSVDPVHGQDAIPRVLLNLVVQKNALEKGRKKLIALSIGDATENGLKMYRASKAHLFFREMSQKLGIKLKPWGAVKMARGLNYLGKAMGAAGIVLPALLEIQDERDADTRERIAQANRENVRSQFNDEARTFIHECEKGVNVFDDEQIKPKIDAIDHDLGASLSDTMSRSVQHTELVKLRETCSAVIRRIRKWQSDPINSVIA